MALLATLSCGRKGGLDPISSNNCEKVAEEYENATRVWIADPTNKAKCEAVKKSLNDIIKTCSVYTAAQKKVYEDQIKQFTCD